MKKVQENRKARELNNRMLPKQLKNDAEEIVKLRERILELERELSAKNNRILDLEAAATLVAMNDEQSVGNADKIERIQKLKTDLKQKEAEVADLKRRSQDANASKTKFVNELLQEFSDAFLRDPVTVEEEVHRCKKAKVDPQDPVTVEEEVHPDWKADMECPNPIPWILDNFENPSVQNPEVSRLLAKFVELPLDMQKWKKKFNLEQMDNEEEVHPCKEAKIGCPNPVPWIVANYENPSVQNPAVSRHLAKLCEVPTDMQRLKKYSFEELVDRQLSIMFSLMQLMILADAHRRRLRAYCVKAHATIANLLHLVDEQREQFKEELGKLTAELELAKEQIQQEQQKFQDLEKKYSECELARVVLENSKLENSFKINEMKSLASGILMEYRLAVRQIVQRHSPETALNFIDQIDLKALGAIVISKQ